MASRHQILTIFKQDKKVKEHADLMLKEKIYIGIGAPMPTLCMNLKYGKSVQFSFCQPCSFEILNFKRSLST